MSGLRIIEAKLGEQTYPISSFEIKTNSNNYTTVIIGNNATGKSILLTTMLNCLRQENSPKLRGRYPVAELTIRLDDDSITVKGDGESSLDSVNLIAMSNSIFDKFSLEARSDTDYAYIGPKQNSLVSPSRGIINDLLDVLSTHLEESTFRHKARQVFSFLKIDPSIRILLRAQASGREKGVRLLNANTSPEKLTSYLERLPEEGFYRPLNKKILKIVSDNEFIQGFHNYLKEDFLSFFHKKGKFLKYQIDFEHENENNDFIKKYKYFSLLRQLNIISYETIMLSKGDKSYDIIDASTGEIGLLNTFLRAIPHLRPNSVIFIDEPEISLHPSWQMQYIELLNRFLEGYTGCHVLIATHSHLILSDLKNECSSVLTLRADSNNQIIAKLKEYTPFGWSPEAILYEVFGVATVRNQLFEFDLARMLKLISRDSDEIELIQQYIDIFEEFKFSEADPLNLVLREAKEYVASKR